MSRRDPVVVLDRDGTLNAEVNYLSHPDQVALLPGVAEGLLALRSAGCRLVVVTNQIADNISKWLRTRFWYQGSST